MDFGDCRSRKLVALAHCLLNQNARSPGTAERPAGVRQLIDGLLQRGVGIVQLPCPELWLLGLDRGDRDIRKEMETDRGRGLCRRLAGRVIDEIRLYEDAGVKVLGILGKNNSPSCGVETTYYQRRGPGQGVFVEELRGALRRSGLELPVTGVLDDQPDAALAAVDGWLGAGR